MSPEAERTHAMAEKVVTSEPIDAAPTPNRFTDTQLKRYPHRCPQYLAWLWERHRTLTTAAEEVDVRTETLSDWLAVFGVRDKCENFAHTHAQTIREELTPADLGLEPSPEGSA